MSNVGGPEFLIIVLISAALLVLPVWALADAAMRPSGDFDRIGQSRSTWLVLLLIGTFCTGVLGLVLGIYYLGSVRPKLRALP